MMTPRSSIPIQIFKSHEFNDGLSSSFTHIKRKRDLMDGARVSDAFFHSFTFSPFEYRIYFGFWNVKRFAFVERSYDILEQVCVRYSQPQSLHSNSQSRFKFKIKIEKCHYRTL